MSQASDSHETNIKHNIDLYLRCKTDFWAAYDLMLIY